MGKLKQRKYLQVNQVLLGTNCCDEVGWDGSGRVFQNCLMNFSILDNQELNDRSKVDWNMVFPVHMGTSIWLCHRVKVQKS